MAHERSYYDLNGQRFPRLTRILSILRDPGLDTVDEDWLRDTQQLGSWLHRLIENDLTGKTVRLDALDGLQHYCHNLATGYQRWKQERGTDLAPLAVEQPLVSAVHGYGATPDLIEAGCLTEWKATSAIRATHWIQLHAQTPLWFAESDWPRVTLRVVRFDRNLGIYEQQERLFDPRVWEAFLHLKAVYLAWFAADLQPKEPFDASAEARLTA